MNTKRWSRGFTLIEMLVVLVVMMVLAVASFPMMVDAIENSKLRGIGQGTASMMRLARFQAIKYNACGVVQLDTANRQVVSLLDRDCQAPYVAQPLLGTLGLPNGVQASSHFPADLVFQGNGSASEKGYFRFVNRKGVGKDVTVHSKAAARISVEESTP